MKKIMKKVVALVAVAAITATTLVGCASGSNVDNSEVVATVGDSQITAGVANFYLRYQQSGMEELYAMYFGDNFWKTEISDGVTYGQDLKNQMMDSLHEFYVLEDHMAEYDVTITEEELAAIDKAAEGFVAANSEKVIKNISGQKENVAEVLRLFTINEKMFKAMTAEVDREVSDDEAVQKRIRYYSKSKLQDGTTDKLPEDELEKVKGEMELFLKGAKANGSMEEFGYQMRGMMKADHKFYKKQGIYDFPQKNKGKAMLMYAVGALLSSEKILSKMGNKMNEGMLMPYEQLFKKMDAENPPKKTTVPTKEPVTK